MLKTVCTVVAFLVITQFSLECTQAFTLPPSPKSQDKGPRPWTNLCGDKSHLNNTSILKGKQQKIKAHETLKTYIKVYRQNLGNINETLDRVLGLKALGDVQPNNLPHFRNGPHKVIHRSLQIYIAIFDYLYRQQKNLTGQFKKVEAEHQLHELREKTRELLCLMEDILNGTDSRREHMKYFTRNMMKKKLRDIEKSHFLDNTIKLALNSIDTFMGEFEKFAVRRYNLLVKQNCNRYKKKKSCLRDHRCKDCKRKKPRANNRTHQFHSHHMRTTPQ